MQIHLASSIATPAQPRAGFAKGAASAALILTLASLWFVLCKHLSSEWSLNEQYNYGWFVPFFALYLFWLRWERRPAATNPQSQAPKAKIAFVILIAAVALSLLLPIRLFEVGNPDWRPLGWVHTSAVVAFTFVILWLIGGKPWVRHFAFPLLFFFVAVPWISPIEIPIIQGLMGAIASITAEAANLLGIPAQLEGNVIHIRNGIVGVNEACSGVRSLQTSLMIGLLFGELKRLSVTHRFILVASAVTIALVANFCRAFFLLYVAATNGISATERWHDIAGYIIVGVVFLGTLVLAKKLSPGKETVGTDRRAVLSSASDSRIPPNFFLIPSLLWILAVEVGVGAWYRAHERNLIARSAWTVREPVTTANLRENKIDEGVRQTLRFDTGRELVWKGANATNARPSTTNYLFFFRWNPSGSSVVRARAHRPDICLPSVGWRQLADFGVKNYATTSDLTIPVRHTVFTREGTNIVAHTFFCLQEDKVNPNEPHPVGQLRDGVQPDWSAKARWHVVRNGVRNLGQQVLEIIIVSDQAMDDRAAEKQLTRIIQEVVVPL